MNNLALVINLGSSSLKSALVDPTGAKFWQGGRALEADETLDAVLDSWLMPELEPYRSAISLVGHRVVHGGERFTAPTLITAEVETALNELVSLAPLHNPLALKGLAWAQRWAPGVPQWACFDTAFTAPCRQRPAPMPYRWSCGSEDSGASGSMASTTSMWPKRWRLSGQTRGEIPSSCG